MTNGPSRRSLLGGLLAALVAWCCPRRAKGRDRVSKWMTALPVLPHPHGTVTITTYDAQGRLISVRQLSAEESRQWHQEQAARNSARRQAQAHAQPPVTVTTGAGQPGRPLGHTR